MRKRRELIRRPTSRPARPVQSPEDEYTVEILGRRYPVVDMVEASNRVSAIISHSGMGASEIGAEFPIRRNGEVVGYVSYNGRVWGGKPERLGGDPAKKYLVYDPSDPTHRAAYDFVQHGVPTEITPTRVVRNNPDGCAVHDSNDGCRADRHACRFGGCDGTYEDGTCKTDPRYFPDTKSFFCVEHRAKFLRDYRWDDRRGDWVERS